MAARDPRRHPAASGGPDAPEVAARPARPQPVAATAVLASRLVTASWVGTGLLAVTAIPAAIGPGTPLLSASVVVSLVLFAAGTVAFLWAYAVAIGRSRTDLIGMGGLFFLAGSAPRDVQRNLIGSFAAEVVIGFAAASARVYTPLAFAVLAPMFGLGVMGLWGAKFGTFPPRPPEPKRPGRNRATTKADPEQAPEAES